MGHVGDKAHFHEMSPQKGGRGRGKEITTKNIEHLGYQKKVDRPIRTVGDVLVRT